MSEEFVGQGWSFPLHTGATGGIGVASGDKKIEESIQLILRTAPGERAMRPEFGCAIHDFVFAPADATTAGRISFEVHAALGRWEPRIEVLDVSVEPSDVSRECMYIDIRYTRRGTNDPRNLVFPFYVIPAHEESAPRE